MAKQTRRNLILDIALTLAFVASLKPFVTGLAVHEWLGLAIGAAIAVHALLHRRWIAGISRRLACPLPGRTRLCYALNAALLLSFAFLVGSGLLLSQTVLPLIGLRPTPSLALATAHRLSAYVPLGLLAIKLALHWRWFVQALAPRRRARAATPAEAPVLATACPGRLSRRRFLVLGGGAACALALVGWYRLAAAQGTEALPAGAPLDEGEAAELLAPTDASPVAPTPAGAVATPQRTAAPLEPSVTVTRLAPPSPTATATAIPTVRPVVSSRCPYGLVNDPYPGRCRRYVDSDGSGYCDYSEAA